MFWSPTGPIFSGNSVTAALVGETIKVARNAAEVRELVGSARSGCGDGDDPEVPGYFLGGSNGLNEAETFDVLNESESILVMVDEAHRSHGSSFACQPDERPAQCSPDRVHGNADHHGQTEEDAEIFGGYLDRYTLTESEADGSTVPIFYEGRTTDAAVKGASRMDDLFYRWFSDAHRRSDERLLQRKYATTRRCSKLRS